MRVVFPYFAQLHQVLHSLPIAAAMAARHPDVEVHVAGPEDSHLPFVRGLLAEHAPDAPVSVDPLRLPLLRRLRYKRRRRTILRNRDYLRSFDAIVTPERTSLLMHRLGLGRTRLIWTRHGAGDRAIGFASDVDRFDFVLMAGRKIEERLREAGLIRPGHYATGVYAKFDWLRSAVPPRLFDNDRPTVLYNPHFDQQLSSWERCGLQVLEHFAASTRYNLIFAPHVRLFDPPTPQKQAAFARFAGLPHVRIDLGSPRSIDMSYVNAADIYLGDVSSQVAEFLVRPRPCVFLNAHRSDWRDDPNYRFWTLGAVIEQVAELEAALDAAARRHGEFAEAQRRYVGETFELPDHGQASGARGADAIVDFLRRVA